jgi:hypothetical protein
MSHLLERDEGRTYLSSARILASKKLEASIQKVTRLPALENPNPPSPKR